MMMMMMKGGRRPKSWRKMEAVVVVSCEPRAVFPSFDGFPEGEGRSFAKRERLVMMRDTRT